MDGSNVSRIPLPRTTMHTTNVYNVAGIHNQAIRQTGCGTGIHHTDYFDSSLQFNNQISLTNQLPRL